MSTCSLSREVPDLSLTALGAMRFQIQVDMLQLNFSFEVPDSSLTGLCALDRDFPLGLAFLVSFNLFVLGTIFRAQRGERQTEGIGRTFGFPGLMISGMFSDRKSVV